jgi:hypothetical protein
MQLTQVGIFGAGHSSAEARPFRSAPLVGSIITACSSSR